MLENLFQVVLEKDKRVMDMKEYVMMHLILDLEVAPKITQVKKDMDSKEFIVMVDLPTDQAEDQKIDQVKRDMDLKEYMMVDLTTDQKVDR